MLIFCFLVFWISVFIFYVHPMWNLARLRNRASHGRVFFRENWHTELQKAKAAANIKWQMARNGMVGIKMHAIKLAKWFTVKGGEIYGMQSVRSLFFFPLSLRSPGTVGQELRDRKKPHFNLYFRFHWWAICWWLEWKEGLGGQVRNWKWN